MTVFNPNDWEFARKRVMDLKVGDVIGTGNLHLMLPFMTKRHYKELPTGLYEIIKDVLVCDSCTTVDKYIRTIKRITNSNPRYVQIGSVDYLLFIVQRAFVFQNKTARRGYKRVKNPPYVEADHYGCFHYPNCEEHGCGEHKDN